MPRRKDERGKMPTKWVIEADLLFLEPAARFAQLNPNAIREFPGPNTIGALSYPSNFCRDSMHWMRALSHLVARGREFSLFLITTRSESDPTEIRRDRIFPVLDPETLDLLRNINEAETEELKAQSERIGAAMERLKERAKLSLAEELSQLYVQDSDN
ncbi:hypothetical protein NUH88_13265 [Nisaea acidiphila]|uniref:Uncharacterized protein n=1 Tax=Nisaea acidiphila TaxID=1862145 RepID=A0A9J7AMJ6_9PROT|nr:hypothetical protein [Nisaea acidiphila]UUX48382.1 hypothetical protein NUH88_13265 [Nisaea acidiphila]